MHCTWDKIDAQLRLVLEGKEDALIEYNKLAIAQNSAVFLGLLLIEGANDRHGMEFKAQVRVHIFLATANCSGDLFLSFFPLYFSFFLPC